ncbi:hypothetical protein SCHPADRAFT_936707 [Schizopora paradoxa]|uniref:Uncharacterized protein n=1 Tax=Schizopora paradoxa TaxID=27342 RepID=A0A0H2S1X6_9AGAM|nr:hypothetical protein SCHPADRAFT_936707 [Schizopora paradoxa]
MAVVVEEQLQVQFTVTVAWDQTSSTTSTEVQRKFPTGIHTPPSPLHFVLGNVKNINLNTQSPCHLNAGVFGRDLGDDAGGTPRQLIFFCKMLPEWDLPSRRTSFLDIFDIFLGSLRELYIDAKKAEYEVQWPDDIRLQGYFKFREWHGCNEGIPLSAEVKERNALVLSILQTLDSLNASTHARTRRVPSYKSKISIQALPPDNFDMFPLVDGPIHTLVLMDLEPPGVSGVRYFYGGAELLTIRHFGCNRFFSRLPITLNSLRILQIKFDNLYSIKRTLSEMLSIAPNLEELSMDFDCYRAKRVVVEELFGEGSVLYSNRAFPICSVLSVIRLTRVSLENLGGNNRLPEDFSCLSKLSSLKEVHFYRHMFPYEDEFNSFCQCIRKLSWTREVRGEFTLDSVYIDIPPGYHAFERKRAGYIDQLIRTAPNLTLEYSCLFVSGVGSTVFPIWPSLQSLTIVTDDFPSPELLQHAPMSIGLLIIVFKGRCCRYRPFFTDRRVIGFLQPRTTRNVRICINSTKDQTLSGELADANHALFTTPSSELFTETRALCARRGGRFM